MRDSILKILYICTNYIIKDKKNLKTPGLPIILGVIMIMVLATGMKPNLFTTITNAQVSSAGSGTFEAISDLKSTFLSSPNELGVIHHVRQIFTSDCTFSGSLKYFDMLGITSAGYYPAPYGAQWATCQINSSTEDFTSGTTSNAVPTSYTFYALENQPDFQPFGTDRNWVGGPIILSIDHIAGVGITLYVHPARTDSYPFASIDILPGRMNWTQGSNGEIMGSGSFSRTIDSGVCGPCDPGSTIEQKSSASFQVTPPSTQPPTNHPPVAVASANPSPAITNFPVVLDGSKSSDPDPGDSVVGYQWQQTSGPKVTLSNPTSAKTSFIVFRVPAKYSGSDQSPPTLIPLKFSLIVTDTHGATSQPATVSVTIKCDPGTESTCDVVNTKVSVIKNSFAAAGLTEAALRLDHWLAGSGFPDPLNVNWLLQTKSIQNALNANHVVIETNPNPGPGNAGNSLVNYASQVPDGQTASFNLLWPTTISIPTELFNRDLDLAAAVGTTQLVTEGDFQITHHGPLFTITGTTTNSVKDIYKFNPGEEFPPGVLPGLPIITADDLNLLEKCRGALPFEQDASWDQTLQAHGTLQQLQHTANLPAPNNPVWHWSGP
jgi:K319-like protein